MFGCIEYALIDENDRDKMDKKSEKCIFIGYSNKSKGYPPDSIEIMSYHDFNLEKL